MTKTLDDDPPFWPSGERSCSFLLRFWQDQGENPVSASAWRFSLTRINPQRERKGFANLEELMAYLQRILNEENCI